MEEKKDISNVKKIVRAMPYDKDAEQAALGSFLIDNEAANMCIPTLLPNDFYISQNSIIFAVMQELQSNSKPVDIVSVSDLLEVRGKLDEVGSMDYLSQLAECVPSAANATYYTSIVQRDALLRRVIEAGNQIAKAGYDAEDGKEALAAAEKLIYSISERETKGDLRKADDALGRTMQSIQNAQVGNIASNVVFTDYPSLDKWTNGFKPGELILLAARPAVGKTAFALNIAANVVINHKKRVAVFCLEMPDESLVKRVLSYVSKVSQEAMNRRGGLSPDANARLFKAYNELLSTELYIDDCSMNTTSDILSKCRRLKHEKGGLDLVIIDYLQLMTADNTGRKRASASRQEEVADLSRRLKVYAKELDLPILVLSQLSRAVEGAQRTDHKPQLSDLRESGAIEQDADAVMFLHKPNQFDSAQPEDLVELILRKNRNGRTGEIKMTWIGDQTAFREQENQEDASDAPVAYDENGAPVLKKINDDIMPFGDNGDGAQAPSGNEGDMPF